VISHCNKVKKKIAFFGLSTAFDYYQVGGTESFIRRLSMELCQNEFSVFYILYGFNESKTMNISSSLILKYYKNIEDAFNEIDKKYDHVVTIYLPLIDRIKYANYRRKKLCTKFHLIFFSWPDSLVKRTLYFSEAKIFFKHTNVSDSQRTVNLRFLSALENPEKLFSTNGFKS